MQSSAWLGGRAQTRMTLAQAPQASGRACDEFVGPRRNDSQRPCPSCHWPDSRRSRRRWYERPFALVGVLPFRCDACGRRYLTRTTLPAGPGRAAGANVAKEPAIVKLAETFKEGEET